MEALLCLAADQTVIEGAGGMEHTRQRLFRRQPCQRVGQLLLGCKARIIAGAQIYLQQPTIHPGAPESVQHKGGSGTRIPGGASDPDQRCCASGDQPFQQLQADAPQGSGHQIGGLRMDLQRGRAIGITDHHFAHVPG